MKPRGLYTNIHCTLCPPPLPPPISKSGVWVQYIATVVAICEPPLVLCKHVYYLEWCNTLTKLKLPSTSPLLLMEIVTCRLPQIPNEKRETTESKELGSFGHTYGSQSFAMNSGVLRGLLGASASAAMLESYFGDAGTLISRKRGSLDPAWVRENDHVSSPCVGVYTDRHPSPSSTTMRSR